MIETLKNEIVKQVDLIDNLLSFYPGMITETLMEETYQVNLKLTKNKYFS